ncbi:hypothetical protein K1719_017364 [Acacia pycnantha]|nr:hypothetical protein K1719_017364 [Acacia pycnantha]
MIFRLLHQVPKGHVAVYWRGGALQKTITNQSFHVKMPFITRGVKINFENIQVVNRLHKEYVYETLLNYGVHYKKTWIHDKIHHHINRLRASHSLQQVYIDDFLKIGEEMKKALQADCTRYASGIEIIGVHVTKPVIPIASRRNFEQLEEERIKVLVAVERQKAAEKEAETSKKMTISEATKNANVSKILIERGQQEIENQMYQQHERCRAYANFYRATKEAEANNRLKLALKFMETFAEIAKRSSGMTSFSPGYFNALLAGLLCGLGNGLQFMGGQATGYAAADVVQALPLVSTFWGIVLFGEFRKSSGKTYILLGSMLSMFVVAVAVLIVMASSGQRKYVKEKHVRALSTVSFEDAKFAQAP